MHIQKINTTTNNKQPQFKAVNQKYLEWAKRDIKEVENVSAEWLHNLGFDVFFKEISVKDAIDTIEFVKIIMGKTDEGIEYELNLLKKKML